jgi:pseudouridine-5'-monophosphatase
MSDTDFHPVTHVIFDFDGLLVDTETCYTKATQAVVEPFGKVFEWHHKVQVMGLAPRLSSQKIIDILELPLQLDDFMAMMNVEIAKALPEADLMPGVQSLVEHFKSHQIPMAIATGSSKESFKLKTARFGDMFHAGNNFQHIVTTADDPEVKMGKPAPDCFHVCASRFEFLPDHPRNVLVFEDAPAGVMGALAAGMQVVYVPDPNLVHEQEATLKIRSLHEFEPELFKLPKMKVC